MTVSFLPSAREDVIIASTTLFPAGTAEGSVRGAAALIAAAEAIRWGYALVVVDGGSDPGFIKSLKELGVEVHVQSKPGLGVARREAFALAARKERNVCIYLELEKSDLIGQLDSVVLPLMERRADIVVPARRFFSTYPPAQHYAECLGNLVWQDLTETELDVWFGPRAWQRDAFHYFLDYEGDYGDTWDSIHIPLLRAWYAGERLLSVEVDYSHPPEQTELEKQHPNYIRKRLSQLDFLWRAYDLEYMELREQEK